MRGIIPLLLILGVGFLVVIYNKLVRLRNLVNNSFSQIDVQLKRRYDLIPNLVETAKGYMVHEKETLERVIQARNHAFEAYQAVAHDPTHGDQMRSLIEAEGQLGGALGRLNVVIENYPDLKANTTMDHLMEELASTENRISFARQSYNDAVMDYNNQREIFPSSLIANSFSFKAATNFEIGNALERENVKVSFNS